MKRSLKLFNTLKKTVELFKPIEDNKISMYICGPTVYDSPHIGHARTYISFDIIRKVLTEYYGYDVVLTMNITDIDDKIITRAAENGVSCSNLTEKYEKEFFTAMEKLSVEKPDFTTRVTRYVEECVMFIEKLENNGLAYESNGSVYFDLDKYKKIHKHNLLRPEFKSKDSETIETEKNNNKDFVLWKASKHGEPKYESKWGVGRPGWHIECSAMAYNIFGSKLDIHAGGIDLAFPHHENEIAQCQGYSGKKWVNYFLHTGHLNINGCKMSKSLKNFLTIDDILKEHSPINMRILFLQHLWNRDMNFEMGQLKEAEAIRKRIHNLLSNLNAHAKKNDKRMLNEKDRETLKMLDELKDNIDESLSNNINTAKALESILMMINRLNQNGGISELHSDVLKMVLKYLMFIFRIFGIAPVVIDGCNSNEDKIAEILVSFRESIRKAAKEKKEASEYFKLCDSVREKLREFNFVIDDGKDSSFLRRL